MRFTKPIATALALSVGALTFAGSAEAGERWKRHRHHDNGGEAVAAGIIGFAAGAILGGALSQPRYGYGYYEPDVVYVEPAPVYAEPAPVYVRPAPVYAHALQPWSPDWYAYCDAKYRSFNPETGYFLGYDGEYHFCR
jgi:hypothetical protein